MFCRFLLDFDLNFGVLVCWFAGCLVVCLACLLNFLAAGLLDFGCPLGGLGWLAVCLVGRLAGLLSCWLLDFAGR